MKMPFDGSLVAMAVDPRVAGTTFGLTGWTHTLLYYRNGARLTVTKTNLKQPSPLDASAYTSAEVQAPSADGTLVPLSLIYRKGLKLDGSHPTYLEGYGAYGDDLDPGFDPLIFAWLDHSGVYAVCHVRGGGWYGEDWHRAGMLATKMHTIDDFIGCGRWLIAHHYTTPQRLAGEGTSAGGITIGGAITRAPQLFAGALDVVGMSDALRGEFSPNGPPNIPEFGTQTTAAGFHDLYPVDAYLHVRDGVAYPAVMLITGINDPRVAPWELGKFAARLAAATSSGAPDSVARRLRRRPRLPRRFGGPRATRCWRTDTVSSVAAGFPRLPSDPAAFTEALSAQRRLGVEAGVVQRCGTFRRVPPKGFPFVLRRRLHVRTRSRPAQTSRRVPAHQTRW